MTEAEAEGDPGRGRTPRRRPRWGWWLGGAVVALVVVWAAVSAWHLVQAERDVHAGVSDAQRARSLLSGTNLTNEAASPPLAASARQFRRAHGLLSSAWLSPLRILPVVGRQVQSADALAGGAAQVTTDGGNALGQVRGLLRAPHGEPAQRAALSRQLAAVVTDLDRRIAAVTLGPSTGLIGPLVHNRNTFARDLAQLQDGLGRAQGASSSMAALLNGHHTYLVFAANNAEMRAGAGMFLEVGTMTVDNGDIQLSQFVATGDITLPTSVPVTGDLARLWGAAQPGSEWRNLALSPQFVPNAELAARMWRAQSGQQVDGVLVVDPVGLADLMTAVGPVTVNGATYNAGNVVRYLTHDQYLGTGAASPDSIDRRDQEGALARAVFHQLTAPGVDLNAAVRGLDQATNGRHLLVWATDPTVEAGWTAAGAGGQVGPDDLLLAVLNEGGNKLDQYLTASATLSTSTVTLSHGHPGTRVAVQVTVSNHTPSGQPPYIAGGGNGSPPGRYVGAIALDMPGGSGGQQVLGTSRIQTRGPDGASYVIAVPLDLLPGQSSTVTFAFVVRGTHGALRVGPSARLNPTAWSDGRSRFTDATARVVRW